MKKRMMEIMRDELKENIEILKNGKILKQKISSWLKN